MELSESTNLSVTEARIAGNRDLFTAENLCTNFVLIMADNGEEGKLRYPHVCRKSVTIYLLSSNCLHLTNFMQ